MIVFLVFALGLMAKPMLVTLPFVLLLLDYWPLGRFELRNLYRLILEKVPLLALSAIASIIAFIAQQKGGAIRELGSLALKFRVGNAFVAYVKYIQKMIWPAKLAVFYPHPADVGTFSMWRAALAVLLVLGITVLVIWQGRRRKYLPVGWLWYLGTLIPVIGLVQVGHFAMADRYSYVSLTGLFIIVAWGAAEVCVGRRELKTAVVILSVVILGAFLTTTRMQLQHWQNSMTLFGHALTTTKNKWLQLWGH